MKTQRKSSAESPADPVITEAWRVKDTLSRRCGGDVDKFFSGIRRAESARRRREARSSHQPA